MAKVKQVTPQDHYKLYVEFEDGVQGTIFLAQDLFGPVFEPLKDIKLFNQVTIDEFGAICWPNGADLAPDSIYQTITSKNRSI